jgi:hypothetical protein
MRGRGGNRRAGISFARRRSALQPGSPSHLPPGEPDFVDVCFPCRNISSHSEVVSFSHSFGRQSREAAVNFPGYRFRVPPALLVHPGNLMARVLTLSDRQREFLVALARLVPGRPARRQPAPRHHPPLDLCARHSHRCRGGCDPHLGGRVSARFCRPRFGAARGLPRRRRSLQVLA